MNKKVKFKVQFSEFFQALKSFGGVITAPLAGPSLPDFITLEGEVVEPKIGKGLCSKYHPDDCCPNNPNCAFFVEEPSTASEKCIFGTMGCTVSHASSGFCIAPKNFPVPEPLEGLEAGGHGYNAVLIQRKINEILDYLKQKGV